jgi:hypothetical protein
MAAPGIERVHWDPRLTSVTGNSSSLDLLLCQVAKKRLQVAEFGFVRDLSPRSDDPNKGWILLMKEGKSFLICIGEKGIDWRRRIELAEHGKVDHEKW